MIAGALLPERVMAQGPLSVFPAWALIIKSEGARLITGHGFDTTVRALIGGRLPDGAPRGLLFEIWYELGVFGAAATAALTFFTFSVAGRATGVIAPFLLAALACIVVLCVSGLPLSQLWWLNLLCTAAIAFAVVMRAHERPERVRASVVGAAAASR